jgi:hypothetical protein
MKEKQLFVNNAEKWNKMCDLIGEYPEDINDLVHIGPVKAPGYSEFFVGLQYGNDIVPLNPTIITIQGIMIKKGERIEEKIKQQGEPDKIVMRYASYIENEDTGDIVIPFKFWKKNAIIKQEDNER